MVPQVQPHRTLDAWFFQLLLKDSRHVLYSSGSELHLSGTRPTRQCIAGEPALILLGVALELHNVDVIAPPGALHLHTFPAVHVHQFEIIVRATGCPALVFATVPRELLHVGSIRAAISGYIQNQAAIYVANSGLPIAQVDEFPALICSAIASVLLDVGVLVRAASKHVNAFQRVDVSEQSTVLRTPLKSGLRWRCHSTKERNDYYKK
jgi:hypothetical protein